MTPSAALEPDAGWDAESTALEVLETATPELLAARLLQQRVDRKFAMPRMAVPALIHRLDTDHRLVRAAGAPAATYETCYFDTVDQRMYDAHRRGRIPRYKVRVRHQRERRLSFLEIKRKGHDGRTCKERLPRTFRDTRLDEDAAAFLAAHCPIPAVLLRPALWLTFRRATLLGDQAEERLTIDWEFEFRFGDRIGRWPQLAIVEVKQPRHHHDTPAVRALRDLGIRETAVSKYCVGIATLGSARANTFKPVVRELEHLSA
jgi:hypothetical protein